MGIEQRMPDSFSNIEAKTNTRPIPVYPDFEQKFISKTYASLNGLGAILLQMFYSAVKAILETPSPSGKHAR